MSNLPSNTPGIFSSEMYAIINDLKTGNSFLVGQSRPFNQFFYIKVRFYKKERKTNYFELIYDFGRKLIKPGETIKLDGIIMARDNASNLQLKYFDYINKNMKINVMKKNIKGWCSWYSYYNKITPEIIEKNLSVIKSKNLNFDLIQIDDGYQKNVGDWLEQSPKFEGRMKALCNMIKENGFIPGIWIAPFIGDKKSELVEIHPDYILRNEYGKPITAGYNPLWPGNFITVLILQIQDLKNI